MANLPPIQFKRSHHAAAQPTPAQLAVGEIAINYTDRAIYTKDSDGAIIAIGGGGAGSSGNVIYAENVDETNYPDISTAIAAATNTLSDGNIIIANVNNALTAIKISSAATNAGSQYRPLVDLDHIIAHVEYFRDTANTVPMVTHRHYVVDLPNNVLEPAPAHFDFDDEAEMHAMPLSKLEDGDVAIAVLPGGVATGSRTIEHLWNGNLDRWEAPGDFQFYSQGTGPTNLQTYWPAASHPGTHGRVFDNTIDNWREYKAEGGVWVEQVLTAGSQYGFPMLSTADEISEVPVGNAFFIKDAHLADRSLEKISEFQKNTLPNTATRVDNERATGIYNNFAADRQGEVQVYVIAEPAYSSSYDALHMIDGNSQGLLSNTKVQVDPTYLVVLNITVQNSPNSWFMPSKMFVRGRNSTSNDHMRQITWTAINKDGGQHTATTNATTRTDYHYFEIPQSFYENTQNPGLTQIRLDCIKADTSSDYGGLWNFQFQKNLYADYPQDGLYYRHQDAGGHIVDDITWINV